MFEQMRVNLNFNTAFLRFHNIVKLEVSVLSKTWLCWFNSYLKLCVDRLLYELSSFKVDSVTDNLSI